MSTSNDRPEPRQFARRLSESPVTTATAKGDANASAPAGVTPGAIQLADLVEEFERWDGLS